MTPPDGVPAGRKAGVDPAAEDQEATVDAVEAEQETDVTLARLFICLESAAYWYDKMPAYADAERRAGNRWAIGSGALAALTGLAIWPLITEQAPPLVAGIVVSGVAFASAICALVSKVNRYTEMAERGQELAGLYGQSLGLLMDLTTAGGVIKQPKAHAAVVLFQQTKIRKDKLYRNPPRGEGETSKVTDFVSRLRTARKMVEIARQQGAGQQGDPAGPSGVS